MGGDHDDCVAWCVMQANQFGCTDLLETVNTCVSQLGCDDFDAWLMGDPCGNGGYPCYAEDVPYFDCAGAC
jgi:hypothetical protein